MTTIDTPVATDEVKISVRINGARGKVSIGYNPETSTLSDVVRQAAEQLGLTNFDPTRNKLIVDGMELTSEDPIPAGATKVDAAPRAQLG